MTKQIAIAASKGGTGKTTTTWNLGFGLSLAGARVLMVDCDPQDNLRFIAGLEETSNTLAAGIDGREISPASVRESLWLLPSGGRRLMQSLGAADGLKSITNPLRQVLKSRVDGESFDFVLFDCPPEFGKVTSAAVSVSDFLLIPCISTWLGLRSIEQMIEFVDTHTRDARIDSERTGIVLTFYTTRRGGPEAVRQEAKKLFKSRVLKTLVRERTELDYSQEAHKSVFEYSPSSDGAADYSSLVKEVIKKLE